MDYVKELLSLDQAIVATVRYFDALDFALILGEIHEYLYGISAPEKDIEDALKNIDGIEYKDGLYFLAGREELIGKRRKRARESEKLWRKVKRWRFLFELCPFVKMVAVVNSLAYENASKKSDIDLFVVTKRGKLSLARFFLKILTQIFGLRVHHNKIAGRFCLSFFVAQDAMDLKPITLDYDPHLAYFVKLAVPIVDRNMYKKWLNENDNWMAQHFKRPSEGRKAPFNERIFSRALQRALEFLLYIPSIPLERLLYNYQLKRDKAHEKRTSHKDGIIMKRNVFKFHEHDTRKKYARLFRNL